MNLLKFLLHCCRNKISYPAEQLYSTVEHLWTRCILATLHSRGTHREHLRTASVWLSKLLSGSADPPQNSVWLIYSSGWCSAPHSAQPRWSELSHMTAKPTHTAFSLHKLTALQLFSTLFPTQNYSVNIFRDSSPNPTLHPVKVKQLCNSSLASIALKEPQKPNNLFSRTGVFH